MSLTARSHSLTVKAEQLNTFAISLKLSGNSRHYTLEMDILMACFDLPSKRTRNAYAHRWNMFINCVSVRAFYFLPARVIRCLHAKYAS